MARCPLGAQPRAPPGLAKGRDAGQSPGAESQPAAGKAARGEDVLLSTCDRGHWGAATFGFRHVVGGGKAADKMKVQSKKGKARGDGP